MLNEKKNPLSNIITGVVVISAIAAGVYFVTTQDKEEPKTDKNSQKIASSSTKSIEAVADATHAAGTHAVSDIKKESSSHEAEAKTAEIALKFSPEQIKEIENIVVNVARDQTEVFMKAISEGMQLQQEKASHELEKNATSEIEAIKKNAVVWGDTKAPLQVFALIDPMCPHCIDFIQNSIEAVTKSKDVAFTIVVAPILGPNSVAVSKVMLASAKQSSDKTKTLMGKFVNKVSELNREKLLAMIKESGINLTKFKADEESPSIQKELEENTALFEKLKIPGVPTLFIQNKDGSLFAAPPLKADVYLSLAVRIKAGEDISKPSAKDQAEINTPSDKDEKKDSKEDKASAKVDKDTVEKDKTITKEDKNDSPKKPV